MNSTLNIINKNRKLENISDMYVIETALTTLCLLITLEDAHIITYSARPDFTGLKYGELYSVNRVISSMKKYFKGLGTTADTLRKQNIITASVVTVTSLTVLSGGYIAIRSVKRRQHASNE